MKKGKTISTPEKGWSGGRKGKGQKKDGPPKRAPKRRTDGRGKTYKAPKNIRKLRLEGTEKQVLDEWVDAIMSGRVTLDEVRRHVGRQGNKGRVWDDYEGNPLPNGRNDNWYLRGGLGNPIDQRGAIEQRVRQIYGTRKTALGTQPSLVVPDSRKSLYTMELGGDALARIDNAWERANIVANQEARTKLRNRAERIDRLRGDGAKSGKGRKKKAGGAAQQAAGGFKRVRVRAGDTLSELAQKHYGDADKWRRIYRQNRKRIGGDPNKIQVGTKLRIRSK